MIHLCPYKLWFFLSKIITYIYFCCVRVGQRVSCRTWFSHSTTWVPRTELRWLGLAARAFIHIVILTVDFTVFFFLMGRCWLGNGVGTQQCARADVPVHHYPRVICVCSSALHSVTPPLCFWTDLLGSFQMLSHGPALDQLLNIYQYSTFLAVGEELGPVVVEVHL